MCGIAGLWNGTERSPVRTMMDRLRHRGPDASGVFEHPGGHGGLGHTRLSIMDPEGGDQPLFDEDRTRAMVSNGEIYNFRNLRKQLEDRHTFATRSDAEAVVHLFEEQDHGTARRLDGMFALAIADGERLYLARDPIGIKPLYLGRRNGSVVFASELKALAGLATDVEEFPAGHWYDSRKGLHEYYRVPDGQPVEMPLEDRLKTIRDTLQRAVVKRLMTDVPLGAFLSGGLDSSLIAALAIRHLGRLDTFSVGIEGSPDLEAARTVARHIGSTHHEYAYTPDEVAEKLPEIVHALESYDQDLIRSAVPCYFTSRLAAQHVKVILTGEGADELFAGYTYYKDIDDPAVLHRELRRSVQSLHNINLQRVDRLTMHHSIEGRVPFLDVEMIEMAQTIPVELKLRAEGGGEPVEKWILRKAFEDLLPREIVWRDKEQFDEGTGTSGLMPRLASRFMPGGEAEDYRRRHPELRSHEECVYHRLLTDAYRGSEVVLGNVARWTDRPDDVA